MFEGIWFNSTELQIRREDLGVTGKVKVFVDPDDSNLATVILPKGMRPIEVQLQVTAFADMTLPEVLKLMAEQRRENPDIAEFHHDQVMRTSASRITSVRTHMTHWQKHGEIAGVPSGGAAPPPRCQS